MRYVLLLLIGLTATGCSPGYADLARELGKDAASVCISATTIYGVVKVARTNIATGTVECTQEGMSVRSGTAGKEIKQ